MDRRAVLKNLSLASAAPFLPLSSSLPLKSGERKFNHSVCRWCYSKYTLEQVADMAIECGIQSVELLNPSEWDIVLNRGLKVALSNGSSLGIPRGFNDPRDKT